MNALITLLIILLGSLILNKIVNNFILREGLSLCSPLITSTMKKNAIDRNAKYKKLESNYNTLLEKAMEVNKSNQKIQHSLKGNKIDTENSIRVGKHKMKEDENKLEKSANAFAKN